MEEVLDALRRLIARWVNTIVPLTEDAQIGESVITLRTTKRIRVGDEFILRDGTSGGVEKQPGWRVKAVLSDTQIELSSPIAVKAWTVANTSVFQKLTHGNFVKQIYLGDPENIPEFPAIVVNGISESSEWIALNMAKDTFSVEIGIYVEDSTQEEGYRFLLRLAKLVKHGLINNIFPLVNDYETTSVTVDIAESDSVIKVSDTSIFCPGVIILIEDPFKTIEHRVHSIIDENTLQLTHGMPVGFKAEDYPTVILVKRFISNSYPKSVNYGKVSKGTLLKAAVIDWFGEEQITNPNNGGGWSDTQIK